MAVVSFQGKLNINVHYTQLHIMLTLLYLQTATYTDHLIVTHSWVYLWSDRIADFLRMVLIFTFFRKAKQSREN